MVSAKTVYLDRNVASPAGNGVTVAFFNLSGHPLANFWVSMTIVKTGGGAADTSRARTQVQNQYQGPGMYVAFVWGFDPGTYDITATVDPEHLVEPNAARWGDNSTSTRVKLYPIPEGEWPTLTLSPNAAGSPAAILSLSQNNPGGLCTSQLNATASAVHIALTPPTPPPIRFWFCTIDALLYRGVKLRNGWTVKSVQLSRASGSTRSPTISPQLEGGSSLEMHVRDTLSVRAPGKMDVQVAVIITGRPGSTPFGPDVATSIVSSPRLQAIVVKKPQ